MQATQYPGLAFSIYSRSVVVVALMLIWLGAATTTKQAGMIFADWPLSMGTFNPPGWLDNLIPFLEHSHRLFAKLVGFLVLGLFCWSYVRSWRKAGEVFGLVFWMALTLAVFIAAGAERFDAERKQMLFWIGLVCASLPMSWLIWSWRLRGWNSIQKWSALALLMVTTQAILGGLRVTEISDGFAVFHGCFAQLFFCVLIFVTMLSSRRWPTLPFSIPGSQIKVVRWGGVVLISLVAIQLLLGAIMRHYHRAGLVDTDLVRTQGEWIPSFEEPLIAVMFLHKFTAMSLLLFTVGLWLLIRGIRSESKSSPSSWVGAIVWMIFIQLALGLTVIGTGKSFWITNLHVLNGLAILAVAFMTVVRAWVRSEGGEDRRVEKARAIPTEVSAFLNLKR